MITIHVNQQSIVRLYVSGVASIEMDNVERRKVGCRKDQGEEGCQRRGKVVWVVLGGGRGVGGQGNRDIIANDIL